MFIHHTLFVMLCCFIDFFNFLIVITLTTTIFLDFTLSSPLNNDIITTW
jgi:hypothetical protein